MLKPAVKVEDKLSGLHGKSLPLVYAVTKLQFDYALGNVWVNGLLYNDSEDQVETWFDPIAAMKAGAVIHDVPHIFCDEKGKPGKQRCVLSGLKASFEFDGKKCYLKLAKPDDWDLGHLI